MGIGENITNMHVEEQLRALNESVGEIKKALLGNEYSTEGGLVKEVKTLRDKVEALEDTRSVHDIYLGILRFIAGIITVGVVGFLIKSIVEK